MHPSKTNVVMYSLKTSLPLLDQMERTCVLFKNKKHHSSAETLGDTGNRRAWNNFDFPKTFFLRKRHIKIFLGCHSNIYSVKNIKLYSNWIDIDWVKWYLQRSFVLFRNPFQQNWACTWLMHGAVQHNLLVISADWRRNRYWHILFSKEDSFWARK